MKISGGKAGSVKRLKKEMERSRGDSAWIRNVKAGEDMTVRFLTEPEEWYSYKEHYDSEVHFFPCIGDECPGCDSDSEKTQRASRRFLANALDVSTGRVVPLKLPLDLANRLVARYERYDDTIMDRDYTLHRMGKGLDTTYDVTPEAPQRMDLSRYELVDLEKALIDQFKESFELDDEPEEPKRSVRAKRDLDEAIGYDEDDDTDDDDDSGLAVFKGEDEPEEDEEDEGYLTEAQALKMSRKELVELASQYDVEIKTNWKKSEIVDAIFEAASA